MGYDFTLFEVTNYNFDEPQKKFDVQEVAYLSNASAMLISQWLDKNHVRNDPNNFNISNHYIEVYCWQLRGCVENLKIILAENDKNKKDLLALFYFPCKFTIPDFISSVEMFSDSYYACLEDIYECLNRVLSKDNENQLFLYNLSV